MDQRALKAQLAHFGRLIALLLNRALMYQANHPFIQQSVGDLLTVANRLLETISPLVFILNRDQFFIDEEPLDSRINVNRTAGLFKSTGLQSISFEKGLTDSELLIFTEVFGALTKLSTAETVKDTLNKRGVFNIKVNHVVFKKVTEDDQVVSRDALKKATPLLDADDPQQRKRFMETLLESVLTEEFAKTLNITNLMANPKAFGMKMIEADLSGSGTPFHADYSGGPFGPGMPGAYGPSGPGRRTPEDAGTAQDDEKPGTGTLTELPAQDASKTELGTIVDDAAVTFGRDGAGSAESAHAQVSQKFSKPPGAGAAGETQRAGAGAGPAVAAAQAVNDGRGTEPGDAGATAPSVERGSLLLHQIELMHREVEMHLQGGEEIGLSDLAEAIFDMKKQLLEGIQAQKALGIAYANEAAIVSAANQLTDQVLLELIKEEYKAGAITTHRLAQIILRLIPEAEELRRLLPRIKQVLLQEGMSSADYLKLIHELRNELENEELSRILQESGEAIGLEGDMLIDEVKRNPVQAAELIYLASEIRKAGGDESALSDVLVNYMERLGERMAKDASGMDAPDGAAHLKKVMTEVESTILQKLSRMNVHTSVLARMEERLNARMESLLDNMRVNWLNNQTGPGGQEKPRMLSVLQTLEHNVRPDDEMAGLLKAVRVKVDAGEIEENNFIQIHEEIIHQQKADESGRNENAIPEGVLSSEEVMFILEKEIARAKRYGVPFSALAFAFVTAKPKMKSLEAIVTHEAVLEAALEKLSATFREVDYIGQVGRNKMLVLLPMATPEEGKKALARVLKLLHTQPLEVRGVSVQLRVAGVVAGYDMEQTPDAKTFTKHLSHQLTDMVARIKSIQVLF